MKKTSIIFFLFYTIFVYSQEQIHTFRNYLKTTPFALYDSENPSFRMGYERRIGKSVGWELGGGVIYTLYDYKYRKQTDSENIGYIFNSELRFYINGNKSSNGISFFGLRGVVIESDNTREMIFSPDDQMFSSPESFHEFVRFQKRIYGVQIVLGGKFTIGKHLYLEGIIGLGTSYRYINNNTSESYPDPVFDRNIRAEISNKNYDNWFTPYPYFQVHIGTGW